MGRIDIPAAIEEEFNAWYNTAYIPGYLGCRVVSARAGLSRSKANQNTGPFTNSSTPMSRRAKRGAGARLRNPWTRRVQPNLRHDDGSPGVYRRIYPK